MADSPRFSAEELLTFEAALRSRRVITERQLDQVSGSLKSVQSSRVDTPADDEHDPEGSTMSFEWSLLNGTRAETVELLAAIDEALQRLASGDYGVCVGCGSPVASERLEARSWAALCIVCARNSTQARAV